MQGQIVNFLRIEHLILSHELTFVLFFFSFFFRCGVTYGCKESRLK